MDAKVKACKRCGAKFTPKREWQKFCQKKCRMDAWISTFRADDPEFVAELLRWIRKIKETDPVYVEIRRAVYRKVQPAKRMS